MPEIPTIVSVDDHVIEPPHGLDGSSPEEVPRRRPTGCRPSAQASVVHRRSPCVGGGRARRRRRHGLVVVLRGPPLSDGAHPQRGEVPARRAADEGHHVRRDDPGRLAARRRASPTWTATTPRRRCAFRRGCGSADSTCPKVMTRTWASCASRPTTTGWSTSGAASAQGRMIPLCIIPLVGRRARGRGGPQERGTRRACGRVQRDPAVPRPPVDPLRAMGSVLRGVQRHVDDRVHAHRVRLQDAVDVGGRAGRGRQRAREHDGRLFLRRLPHVGVVRTLPQPEGDVQRRAGRVAAVHARPGRRRLGREPRVGRGGREGARTRRRATSATTSTSACSRTRSRSRTSTRFPSRT